METTAASTAPETAPPPDHDEELAEEDLLVEDLLVEDVSIDGMCGVY